MKIVAIGGGEIGRPGTKVETLKIDKELVLLSKKKNPKLLFIPTASHDSQRYVEVVENYFGKKLGCRVDTLFLYKNSLSKSQLEKQIMSADIIYVGGGNTLKMLRLWRKFGIDKLLAKAAAKGKVLGGVSAGAVCWFRYANSDSRKMVNPAADYIKIRGLDLAPLFLVPHFDKEEARQDSLKRMLKGTRQVAIGLDNCAALVINGNQYKIVTSKPNAVAHRCYWKKNKYFIQKFKTSTYEPLQDLLITA